MLNVAKRSFVILSEALCFVILSVTLCFVILSEAHSA